jgi:hypothetical protein
MSMQTLTFEQLRSATVAGGVSGVTVKAQGGGFFVQIATRNGDAILTKARSTELRCFSNPFQAITLLHGIGITNGTYDVSQYDPEQKKIRLRPDRAKVMKRAHEAAAYDAWFREQVQASIEDPRPSVKDEDVRAEFASRRKKLLQRSKG